MAPPSVLALKIRVPPDLRAPRALPPVTSSMVLQIHWPLQMGVRQLLYLLIYLLFVHLKMLQVKRALLLPVRMISSPNASTMTIMMMMATILLPTAMRLTALRPGNVQPVVAALSVLHVLESRVVAPGPQLRPRAKTALLLTQAMSLAVTLAPTVPRRVLQRGALVLRAPLCNPTFKKWIQPTKPRL